MSRDFLTLPRQCDHEIASERLLLSEDNQTLYAMDLNAQRMTGPVNGVSTVKLRINDVDVPRDHTIYGWDLLPDEWSINPDKRMKVVFRKPVRLRELRIEVSYVTLAAYCWKCGGTAYVSDLQPGTSGSYLRIVKRQKMVQRALKFLLTSNCPYYQNLTSQLREYIGKKYGPGIDQDGITWEVQGNLDNLKQIQASQAAYQALDPEEIMRSVDAVTTTRDASDPTVVHVKIDVSSPAGTRDQINVGLRVFV
jgi:hypothetical protein